MNPRRLIDETSDPTEALLLRAVKSEQLSGPRRQRILASFGSIGADPGTPGGDTVSREIGSLAATAAGQMGAAFGAKISLLHAVSVKWIGLCALALVSGAVVMARHSGPPSAGGSTGASEAAPAAAPFMVHAAGEVATQEALLPGPAAATSSANPVAAQQVPRGARANALPSNSLSQEVVALKEVRRALAGHDAAGAFRALDRYDRQFATGRLGLEAAALRIEALAMQGDLVAANALATRVESLHPMSPYRARLRSILSAAANR